MDAVGRGREVELQQLRRLTHDARGDLVEGVGIDHHADGLRLRHKQPRAQRNARVRAAAALRAAEIVEVHAAFGDLLHAADIAQRAEPVRPAAGDFVIGSAELFAHAVHLGVDVVIVVGIHEADVGVHQILEQLVALALGHAALFQDQDGRHAELFGAGRRQHGVVRLGAAGRKDDLRALPLRVGEQELELAHLVAAEADARQIIALDIDIGVEQAADVLQLLDRRRQRRQTDAGKILQVFHIASLIFPMVWWIGMRRGRAAAFIMPQRYAAVKRRGGRRGYFFNRHIISRFHLSEKQEIQMSAISAANGCISAASRPCRSTRGTPPTGHRDTP